MKALSLLLSILLAIVLSSCADDGGRDNSTGVQSIVQGVGSMTLQFRKADVPAGIDSVIATLSRPEFSTITRGMSILSDTSAAIEIDSVAVGTWKLRVEAKDMAGNIKYAGEADVEVLEAQTAQVNLTLEPTASGTGSIHIVVQWGTGISGSWEVYGANPVLAHLPGFIERHGILRNKVLIEGSQFKMWFGTRSDGDVTFVNYALSTDGKHWTRYGSNPVVSPTAGAFDAGGVELATVVRVDSMYRMYYNGFEKSSWSWYPLMASSVDGIVWEKSPTPILQRGSSGDWDPIIAAGDVVQFKGMYYLYFTGRGTYDAIGVATSTDGTTWTKYAGNPILTADRTWEGGGVYTPAVIATGGHLEMVYMGHNGDAFGAATSTDGLHWMKTGSGPVFEASQSPGAIEIGYPSLARSLTMEYLYYAQYMAGSSQNGYSWECCLATQQFFSIFGG